MFTSTDRQEHIQHLEQVLTDIAGTRERISKLFEEKLTKEQRSLIDTEVVEKFLILQTNIANQIRRLRERRY
ncbi:MAG: hypothetical protein UX04_C0002G0208 [Microgenomates group bacterium GW2011_GWF2_45_18]|nr:MAG: hypothetical protein UW18_C0003G0354 [Microgenomates group bacterium GW2011_GWF1_44_10]KKU02065.1 MAG: hypothetical protein UX04_C0002G0208 [Microgenomates group bacterium GW2011_GWF2_45_18]